MSRIRTIIQKITGRGTSESNQKPKTEASRERARPAARKANRATTNNPVTEEDSAEGVVHASFKP